MRLAIVYVWLFGGVVTGIVMQQADLFGPDAAKPDPAQVAAFMLLWPLFALIGLVFTVAAVGEAAFHLLRGVLG